NAGGAGGEGEAGGAAFEGRDAFFEHVGGGVHQAGVDVAEFLEGEAIGRVFGAFEDVGGGSVQRHAAGEGGGVGLGAAVQEMCVEARVMDWLVWLARIPSASARSFNTRFQKYDAGIRSGPKRPP